MARCHYCGTRGRMTVDHIVPFARGGSNVAANRIESCLPCNQAKGSDWPTCMCAYCATAIKLHTGSRELRPAYRDVLPAMGPGPRCKKCGEITMDPANCPWCAFDRTYKTA